MNEGSEWIFNASGPVILLGLLAFFVYLGVTLYHLKQVHFTPYRWLTEGLKFLGALLLLFTLLQPELHTRSARHEDARMAVVLDRTESMDTQDALLNNAPATRTEWLEQLQASEAWQTLTEAAQVEIIEVGHSEDPVMKSTNLASSLERAREFDQLAAVLMLSDGVHNSDGSPLSEALRLAEMEVPVFAVEVGESERLPDLLLEQIEFPTYSLLNEALVLPLRVSSTLPEDAPVRLALMSEGRVLARQEVMVEAGESADTQLRWVPRTPGEVNLQVVMESHPLERFTNNNEQTAVVDIRKTTIRVLLIDSLPRWEFRFLRNALNRDPGVKVDSILFHPFLGPGTGPGYLKEFPTAREMWSQYDVVFLGDVGIMKDQLRPQDAVNLDLLVREQGSGLVFLPGAVGNQLKLAGSPLEKLNPVEYDPRLPKGIGFDLEMRMNLTREGQGHLLTQLHSNEVRNQQIWRRLPGFNWFAGVSRSKVGAEVLATHASQRNENGRIPLLATRDAGAGHVLFLGTDAAWRWREGVEDLYHYRFWGQVVRWMAHKRHMFSDSGARVFFQPERPEVGQETSLTVTLRGALGLDDEDVPVRLRFTDANGGVVSPTLTPLEGGGTFTATWTPENPGEHTLELLPTSGSDTPVLSRDFMVEGQIPEQVGDPTAPRLLEEVAQVTGGESVTMEDAELLLERLSQLPRQQLVLNVTRLWQNPLWVSGVFLFFGLYWILRKRQGWI